LHCFKDWNAIDKTVFISYDRVAMILCEGKAGPYNPLVSPFLVNEPAQLQEEL
jgi:hypothetical protein